MAYWDLPGEPPTRRAVLVSLGALASSSCVSIPAKTHPASLAEIVRRNTRARGGAAALDRVRSIAVDVDIDERGQKLNGHYVASIDRLVRIDIYVGGKFAGAEGIDPQGVWSWGKDGPEPSVATGAANALLHGAESHLFGWHRFARRGHSMALMPPETIAGVTYQVVEIRYSTGHVSYFYVDPLSWQATRRRDERAYHPDVDETKQRVETRFSEFVPVDGVIAPHLDQDFDLGAGKLLATHRVVARRINPDLPPDYFDRNRRAPAGWS